MRTLSVLIILGLCLGFSQAFSSVGASLGYVSDVSAEKAERFYEVYLFVPTNKGRSLQEMIFSPLSREFKEKYLEKFGEVDTESVVYHSHDFSVFDQNRGHAVGLETENQKRKEFAEYVTKRLTEYHVDNYMKTQPQMAPVLEVKQRIQNVKVEVSKEVRLNIQYNFAGNNLDLIADNPWCDSKLAVEMDPHSFGPTSPQELRVWVGKNISHQMRLNSQIALTDGIVGGDIGRSFSKWNLASTLGVSTNFKSGGTSIRETKYLVGFSHSY
jgi:hypothetical protein